MNTNDFISAYPFETGSSSFDRCECRDGDLSTPFFPFSGKENGSWYSLGFTMGQLLFSGCIQK